MLKSLFSVIVCCVITTAYAEETSCPSAIRNSYECAQHKEKELGVRGHNLFAREKNKLRVKLGKGFKEYLDSEQVQDSSVAYSFIEYYPAIGYGLIEVQYYEGIGYLFLNLKTGNELMTHGYPVISPNQSRIAFANLYWDGAYESPFLAVYRINGDKLIQEFEIRPEDWSLDNARWVNETTLSFDKWVSYSNKENQLLKCKKSDQGCAWSIER